MRRNDLQGSSPGVAMQVILAVSAWKEARDGFARRPFDLFFPVAIVGSKREGDAAGAVDDRPEPVSPDRRGYLGRTAALRPVARDQEPGIRQGGTELTQFL